MTKKLHWFPFYYLDWLSDSEVAMMTYSEKGLFIDMLARCFNEEGLSADENKLLRLFKCDKNDLQECVKMFYKKDEKLFNKKLDGIKKEQKQISKERSKAGKASAEARKAQRLKKATSVKQVLDFVGTNDQQNSTSTVQQNTVQNNKEDLKEVKAKAIPKKFQPPTILEVTNYCKERANGIDANKFIDHYSASGWMRGKNKIKDWKACVRTWEGNQQDNQPQTEPQMWIK